MVLNIDLSIEGLKYSMFYNRRLIGSILFTIFIKEFYSVLTKNEKFCIF